MLFLLLSVDNFIDFTTYPQIVDNCPFFLSTLVDKSYPQPVDNVDN